MAGKTETNGGGRSPFFYAGLILFAYAIIIALASTDAINSVTALILMVAPLGLVWPMMKAATRRIDSGGPGCFAKGEAQKRYMKRVAISTSLYLIALAAMTFGEKQYELTEPVRVVLATLPGLAIVGVFWAVGRLIIEEQDEFIRMLVIRQALIATGFAMSAASVWGFLETADIVVHLDAYWWAVVWFFGLFVGAVMNRIQYGTWGAA
uniref:hypothetical protein n=1 Tax=Parerythrobacter lutipelagi TaxID=1964208 RepID=UPI0010F7D8A3|nr:hypothetical protein [Parerythrobacter lutipelagi]